MLLTHTMVVGRQTNHPSRLTSVCGVIENVQELEVFANATSSGSVLEADANSPARVYATTPWRGNSRATILVTIGTWVSWTVETRLQAADLDGGQTTEGHNQS